ncbi:MAG: ABC transporter substrate-binding protein [Betaproteobacteria bacterium]|nr:ABC transporter substrate-binding protein [Betaproteobacteria bacterium]
MSSGIARSFSWGVVAAGLAFGAGVSRDAGAAQELRIGFLAPTTGIFAQVGKDMTNGFQLYLDEVKGDFAGAKVKFIVEDEEGKPPVGVRKVEKLIRQDKVHMFIGGLLASTGYALAPVSTRLKTVYVASIPAADDLTQRDSAKFPYLVRTGWTSSQPNHPFGEWACEQGYKRIAAIAADYAFGHEVVGGFQKAFEACGGRIIQKIWPPLGTIDFGPFLPAIKKDADAIFTLMVGPMSLQFPKQLASAGIKKPVLGGGTSYDEFVLPSMGDEVIGHVSALQYSAALETPQNAAFVKKYRGKYGKVPSYYSESNYTTAQMIHEVMKRTKGKWPGAQQFVKLLASVKLETARGPVRLDEMKNPVHNVYIRKVERKKLHGYDKDELWNSVIKTYPNVGQFWKFGKNEFLKQPVYSRDFPPCKHCE